jgi:hypothetical protein
VQALLSKLSDAVSQLDGDEGDAEDEFGEGAGEEEEEDLEDLEDDTAFTAEFGDVVGNPVVSEYEALIQNQLVPFLAAATEIGGEVQKQAAYVAQAFAPPPPSRTKWTRRVPHLVLIGHAASLTPYAGLRRAARDARRGAHHTPS